MKNTFRCKCPITSALDIVGDKWSLVLIKQMLFEGKTTFKDFTDSTESIATNILSSRLKMLEEFGIVEKHQLPGNKKTNIYVLTSKGLALTPVLIELTYWSKDNIQEFNHGLTVHQELEKNKSNKERIFSKVIENYGKQRAELLEAQ